VKQRGEEDHSTLEPRPRQILLRRGEGNHSLLETIDRMVGLLRGTWDGRRINYEWTKEAVSKIRVVTPMINESIAIGWGRKSKKRGSFRIPQQFQKVWGRRASVA